MKRFRIYSNGTFDPDSLVVLDFGTVPEDSMDAAEREAFEISISEPVGDEESIEDVYQNHPQVSGFVPWIWKLPGGWNPQGLNRELLMLGQKLAAKAELGEYLRIFVDTYHHYVSHDEIREILEQALGTYPDREREK
jgi:hypothetical protein